MTVDELIEQLQILEKHGRGSARVLLMVDGGLIDPVTHVLFDGRQPDLVYLENKLWWPDQSTGG